MAAASCLCTAAASCLCLCTAVAQGDTTDKAVVTQVNATAKGKKVVMVTLDSGHNALHVAREMEAYCPLVTVGAYCIVEVGCLAWTQSYIGCE